jgi:hypothetical protein
MQHEFEYESERFTVEGLTVKIIQDQDAENPRDNEFGNNLTKMVCWHRRYTLGDADHGYENPQNFQESDAYRHAAVIQPLYLYDHSGEIEEQAKVARSMAL